MSMAAFADRTFRVEDRRRVVADATVDGATLRHLVEGVRARRHALSVEGLQDADAVLHVRGLTALADRLDALFALGDPVPVSIDRHEAVALAEAAVSYGASRDTEGYLPPGERERVDALESTTATLMDVITDLVGAEAEAVERGLLVQV
jgi:hypothetical protein